MAKIRQHHFLPNDHNASKLLPLPLLSLSLSPSPSFSSHSLAHTLRLGERNICKKGSVLVKAAAMLYVETWKVWQLNVYCQSKLCKFRKSYYFGCFIRERLWVFRMTLSLLLPKKRCKYLSGPQNLSPGRTLILRHTAPFSPRDTGRKN